MGDSVLFQFRMELTQVFTPVVGLPDPDLSRIHSREPSVEVLHMSARKSLVVEGEGKPGFHIDGAVKVVLDTICHPFHCIRDDMAEVDSSGRVANLESLLSSVLPGKPASRIMVDPP